MTIRFGAAALLVICLVHPWPAHGVEICPADMFPLFTNDVPIPARVFPSEGRKKSRRPTVAIEAGNAMGDLGLFSCEDDDFEALGDITPVYGFGADGADPTYPGPTIDVENFSGSKKKCSSQTRNPVNVEWTNKIRGDHINLDALSPEFHVAFPKCEVDGNGLGLDKCIPISPHLHGGNSTDIFDGYPERLIDFGETRTFVYSNEQGAGHLWIHDHVLGVTRLNVNAGLAMNYLIRSQNEIDAFSDNDAACALEQVDSGGCELELLIQDRSFTTDGQLAFPLFEPEFFGDYILVNGVVWPKLEVKKRFYRYRLLNGSDSRVYLLQMVLGDNCFSSDELLPFIVIGRDQGFTQTIFSVPEADGTTAGNKNSATYEAEYLVISPGQRYDVLVDFSQLDSGCEVTMTNSGAVPFNSDIFLSSDELLLRPNTDKVMQIAVDDGGCVYPDPIPIGLQPGPSIFSEKTKQTWDNHQDIKVRKLILTEQEPTTSEGPGSKPVPLLGAFVDGVPMVEGQRWCDRMFGITETPTLGDTEVWVLINLTGDAHPIHLHQVDFLEVETCTNPIDPTIAEYPGDYDCQPFDPDKTAPVDIVIALDGETTVIKSTFTRPGLYVWHCHILSHEDDEMMRPLCIVPEGSEATETCFEYYQLCANEFDRNNVTDVNEDLFPPPKPFFI